MQQFLKNVMPFTVALTVGMASVTAYAGSSASSAASESVGSSSTSIQQSSNSSSTKDKVAQGQYTIIEMAQVAEQPDLMRLRLRALAPLQTEEFFLLLPRQVAQRVQLATGDVVEAQHRPYGLAFATVNLSDNSNPFFLVLEDAWYRELQSRPVAI